MDQPTEYEDPTIGLFQSVVSKLSDNALISGEPCWRPSGAQLPYWPIGSLDLERVIHRRWLARNQAWMDIWVHNLYPDGRARPKYQALWPNPGALKHFRKVHTVDLYVPIVEARVGLRLDRDPDNGLLMAQLIRWLPLTRRPDLAGASEYAKECKRLQATKAGRKAKRLLMDKLTDVQRRDYYTKGTIVVLGNHPYRPHYYVLDNSYPNGNIFKIKKGKPCGDYCFHPEEPYPMDDILLAQKMLIETDEEGFREGANFTERDPEDYYLPSLNGYPIRPHKPGWVADELPLRNVSVRPYPRILRNSGM